MVVPARPRRHRSLVTLSRLLPFPLKEAAAPGAQRTRRESQPRTQQPAMSPQCVSNVPAIPLLVFMQQHLCPPGPGPTTLLGQGAGAGGWMTPPAQTGRAATASWGVPLPGLRVPAGLLPPSQASPSQAPLEHKEPSGKAIKQGPRCSPPSVSPQRKWTGMVSSGCFSQPQDTRFSTLFTKKNQVPKRPQLRDQVSLLNLSK